jgi:hypothetical protein
MALQWGGYVWSHVKFCAKCASLRDSAILGLQFSAAPRTILRRPSSPISFSPLSFLYLEKNVLIQFFFLLFNNY